jgi:hypothetical protein
MVVPAEAAKGEVTASKSLSSTRFRLGFGRRLPLERVATCKRQKIGARGLR